MFKKRGGGGRKEAKRKIYSLKYSTNRSLFFLILYLFIYFRNKILKIYNFVYSYFVNTHFIQPYRSLLHAFNRLISVRFYETDCSFLVEILFLFV